MCDLLIIITFNQLMSKLYHQDVNLLLLCKTTMMRLVGNLTLYISVIPEAIAWRLW